MTGSMSLDLLKYGFTLITLLGIAALGWQVVRAAPGRMQARAGREIAERNAAMTALAEAHARTPDGPTRDALARNYRFHRAAVLALNPALAMPDLDASGTLRRAA